MAEEASSSSSSERMPHAAAPQARDVVGGDDEDDQSPSPLPYRILVEFAYKHVDFHLAELESILEGNGIVLLKNGGGGGHHGGAVQVDDNSNNGFLSTTKSATAAASKKYCRIVPSPSSSSSSSCSSSGAATSGVGLRVEYRPPYAVLEFSSPDPDIGETIMSQCTLVRCAVELWGMGDTVESCVASTREFSRRNGSAVEPHKAADKTWKITVHALGSTIPVKEQESIRSQLSFLEFAGPVRLKGPHSEFLFLKEVQLDATGPAGNLSRSGDSSSTSSSSSNSTKTPEDSTRTFHKGDDRESSMLACYFGRVLGGIRTTKNRAGLEQYTLKKRAYLGPTSMDAELAFVMASLGKVKVGSFVYDPFVGTGSILVACALKGAAHVVGADIDIRVLRGRSPTENIQSNFAQFGLPRPELLRTDNAIYHRHYRRHATLYDAIVTDPPYGIRAGARKCGSKLDQARPVPEDCRSTHIPQTRYGRRASRACSLHSLPRWFF
jgi:tRNA (guanine10-N2)-methyltransferase